VPRGEIVNAVRAVEALTISLRGTTRCCTRADGGAARARARAAPLDLNVSWAGAVPPARGRGRWPAPRVVRLCARGGCAAAARAAHHAVRLPEAAARGTARGKVARVRRCSIACATNRTSARREAARV